MEAQIQQAVEIAFNPASTPQLKQQALEFIDEIKATEDAWNACLPILYSDQAPDTVKLFVFQIIDSSIPSLTVDQLDSLKSLLLEFFKGIVVNIDDLSSTSSTFSRSGFLKNKLATTFSYMFYYSYLNIWPGFFKTFIKLIENDDNNKLRKLTIIDYYLRILLSIHSEIGDQLYQNDPKTVEVSNNLKDVIRMNDMSSIVMNWKYIIEFIESSNNTDDETVVVLKTLFKVIGSWVGWIDITLIIGDKFFLDNFYKFFEVKMLRDDIIELFMEIISKKMSSDKKMELLQLFNINQIIATSMSKLQLLKSEDLENSADDVNFYEHISKLINTTGIEYLIIIEKSDSSIELKQLAFTKLNEILPFFLEILPNDYDDISLQIFGFISNFLTILKKIRRYNNTEILDISNYNDFLENLLTKIIIKMKYDEEDDGLGDDEEDEDVREFEEMRSKLKVFQEAISNINPDLYLTTVNNIINETLFKPDMVKDWRTFELGLYELTNFSEILRINTMKLPKNEINKSKPFLLFQGFLIDLINKMGNMLVQLDHPLIQLSFLELITKHYNFFINGPPSSGVSDTSTKNFNENNVLTNNILEIINSKYGLFNNTPKVQKRCFYLFARFIKLTKPRLETSILKNLVVNLTQSLLLIKAKIDNNSNDNKIIDLENDEEVPDDVLFDNQLYLFETVGLLISLYDGDKNEIAEMIDLVLNPIFNDLKQCMDIFGNFSYPLDQQQILLQVHHCITAMGTFARGFEQQQVLKNLTGTKEVVGLKFKNSCEASVMILEQFRNFRIIRDCVRFLFSRMMPILQGDIRGYLTTLISIALANEKMSSGELISFVSFINQIIYSFNKDGEFYDLLNELVGSLIDRIFKTLECQKMMIDAKINDDSVKTDKKSDPIVVNLKLQRVNVVKSYLGILLTMMNNHVFSVLLNDINQKWLPPIFNSVFEYVCDVKDAMVCKLAFNVLQMMVEFLSGGVLADKEDCYYVVKGGAPLKVDGVNEYLLKQSVAVCFEIPFKNSDFDLKDGQSRLIINEVAMLLKSLCKYYNDVFVKYMVDVYFVEINLPGEVGNELMQATMNLGDKEFKQYFIGFVGKMK
ncbi:Ran GTPase-binding protein [Saccharomycopsis crataegensis]|uniref:Exportin-T n=1 Tax=Saccharomycopsis crataegensis TaxID=43959 RepID=A0AAV5QRJ5_9ASCO|nr:Ran GTPase-binding protein [Saccharomycopsis crataegensis]